MKEMTTQCIRRYSGKVNERTLLFSSCQNNPHRNVTFVIKQSEGIRGFRQTIMKSN